MFYRADKKGNIKSVRMDDLPPEAWRAITGKGSQSGIAKAYSYVSWMYRCVNIRANAVQTMPFVIRRGNDIVAEYDGVTFTDQIADKQIGWATQLPRMLHKVEAASVLGGTAYFERRKNFGGKTIGFDWLLPDTMTPKFSRNGELTEFTRTINGRKKTMAIEDVVYFWYSDHTVETGASSETPGKAALTGASVLRNMNIFLAGYFQRGMIKATLLKYKDPIMGENEKIRVKEWWRRVFSGVKNAHATEVVRGDFDTLTIGDGIADLGNNTLTNAERETIATAFGVPQSKLTANAANFATKRGDDVMFVEDVILPEISWIYEAASKQMLPDNYYLVAQPQKLRVMQDDENKRARAFASYVNSGLAIPAVISILGISVPDGVQLIEPVVVPPASPPPKAIMPEVDIIALMDKRDETARLKRWLKKRGDTKISEFDSTILSAHEKAAVAARYVQSIGGAVDAIKANQSAINSYTTNIQNTLQKVIDKKITRDAAITTIIALVTDTLTKHFRQEIGVPNGGALTEPEQTAINKLIAENADSVAGLVDDAIAAANEDTTKRGDKLASIFKRLALWGGAIVGAVNLGRIFGREKEKTLTWRIGATENHCATCLEQNGQTHTKAEWQKIYDSGIYPQSRNLECGGYRCDCSVN